jgi:hypothetical protein
MGTIKKYCLEFNGSVNNGHYKIEFSSDELRAVYISENEVPENHTLSEFDEEITEEVNEEI